MQIELILYAIIGALSFLLVLFVTLFILKALKANNLKIQNLQKELSISELSIRLENLALNISDKDEFIRSLEEKIQRQEYIQNELEQLNSELKTELASTKKAEQMYKNQNDYNSHQNEYLRDEKDRLKTELSALKTSLDERQKSFDELEARLNSEFEILATRILNEKAQNFKTQSTNSLELMLKPLKDQIANFEKRTNEIHDKSQENSINLQNELKRIFEMGLNMSKEATNLTNALKSNNKIAGNWGEAQLERTLQSAGLVKDIHYITQANFKDENGAKFIPDFVLILPDQKHMVIDSKVSLVAYEKAISADSDAEYAKAMSEHVKSIKSHVDSLSTKEYSKLKDLKSPDFVLMFMPIEASYIEAMRYDREIFSYAYDKAVILVSHTTLMPIVRTISNLWRIERGNQEARQIAQSATDIYDKLCVVGREIAKLGSSLQSTCKQYNQAVISLSGRQGLYGKVDRFKQLSSDKNILPDVKNVEIDVQMPKMLDKQDA